MTSPTPTPPQPPRLFLVDGYALIYRAFFALISRPLTTSRGENTSAAWGIANFLQRLMANHKPEYLGWVHDSGLSFRHETYPDYKATREKLTDELQADFDRGMERIRAMLDAYRIPIMTLPGYEADDVIGTLAMQGAQAGVNVVIISGDKDFQQLVRPHVWLLNPGRGGPANVEEHWVGEENASERLGVAPQFVTDYLALVGDTSDNVPGVKGIGEKGARELVETYGSIESILAHATEITKKRPREALLEQAAMARLSKELVTIRCDLPITLALDTLTVQPPDGARLRDLFVELEFHTLAKTIDVAGAPAAVETPAEAVSYTTVSTLERLRDLVTKARTAPHIAVDVATMTTAGGNPLQVDPLRTSIVGIAIATAPREAFYIPLAHRSARGAESGAQGDLLAEPKPATRVYDTSSIAGQALTAGVPAPVNLPPLDDAQMAPLRELLEDATVKKTAHNGKFDILVLRNAGITLRGLDFDTMVASYVIDPGRRSYALDQLALELLNHKMTAWDELCGKTRSEIPFDQVPIDCARDFAAEAVDMTLRLRDRFDVQLEEHAGARLFHDVEMPLVEVLAEMEWAGITVDTAWLASLKVRFQKERERVEREIYEAAGETFNIASNPQLRVILFEKLGLPILKKTPTGPSTDASVLQQLADEGHALPTLLMEYRELSKLESTYLDTLPASVNPRSSRVHTTFNQTGAATGRLSSSDPNLQNIPIRRELGRDIRRGFVPRAGWTLLAADYSQIELRLLAHLSHDPAFVEAFNAGGDIHRQTASVIFGVPVADVTSDMRGRAKTINFATIYGQGAHALSLQLKIEFAEAKAFIATYFERFKGIRDYLDSMVEYARTNGYVQTITGRRRYIPELRERNFNIRAFGERLAANSPIQGSAADLIKIAMIQINAALRDRGMESKMLLQVHDELVFDVAPSELDAVAALVREHMERAAKLSVPLVVDIGVGGNWLETKL